MAEEEAYSFDPWDTSTGLPDKITVRIENPHFGYNVESATPTRCLFICEGTIVAGTEDGASAEFNQWFSVGDGWEPGGKGGARLVREDGRPKQLNQNSNYGRFFTSLRKAAEVQELMDQLRKRGTPFDAATWLGLEVYLERESYTYEDRNDDNKTKEASRLNVVRIDKIGDAKVASPGPSAETVESAASVSSTPATTPAEPAPVAAAATNGGVSAVELDPKLKAKLKALAREVRTGGSEQKVFVERAFDEVDGVLDNAVAEEAIMANGDGSIWESVAG